jgi:hypothetical protein
MKEEQQQQPKNIQMFISSEILKRLISKAPIVIDSYFLLC